LGSIYAITHLAIWFSSKEISPFARILVDSIFTIPIYLAGLIIAIVLEPFSYEAFCYGPRCDFQLATLSAIAILSPLFMAVVL
jgi:hypothetical protein